MRLSSLAVIATVCLMNAPGSVGAAPGMKGPTPSDSFRGRLAIGQAEALLASDVLSDRVRGLERLGGTNTPRAIERLIRAIQPGSGAPTPEERLVAVRELAAHTGESAVRRALGRVLGGHAAPSEQRGPLDELAQASAALSLAHAGTPDALGALGKALSAGGAAARVAEEALVAHPPHELAPLLAGAAVATEELAETLAELGDQRAFAAMRSLVQSGTPEVRGRAAVGLTELGDYETVALAERWVRPGNAAALRVAGARILALSHADGAAPAIRALLEDDTTWQDGLTLALDAPSPELVVPLSRRLSAADDASLGRLISAIGRAGGPGAVGTLGGALRFPRTAVLAAAALGRMKDDAARLALERALSSPETRRLAALGLAMRKVLHHGVPSSLGRSFESLYGSKDERDRIVGAVGLAVLDPSRSEHLLESSDPRVVVGVATTLLIAPKNAARAAVAALARRTVPLERSALALGLARDDTADAVPTEALLALVDEKSAAAPLAARALAARDEERTRDTVEALLSSDDPGLRLHTALGLGRSESPDAAGRLAGAYRFEVDPRVRRAIVFALSGHSAPIARLTLELAARLDPDRKARTVARLSLGGERRGPALLGDDALLFSVPRGPGAPAVVAVATPSGVELPVVPGPDGLVFAPGVPEGSEVAVAPANERGKDSGRGASGDQKDDRGNGIQ